jgi:hypothetical protein
MGLKHVLALTREGGLQVGCCLGTASTRLFQRMRIPCDLHEPIWTHQRPAYEQLEHLP